MIIVSVLTIMDEATVTNDILFVILEFIGNPALLSIVGAHILFNMKEAGENGLNQGTSCGSKSTASEIDFADAPQDATNQSQEDAAETEAIAIEEIC